MAGEGYEIIFGPGFDRIVHRLRKNPGLLRAMITHFPKLEREPELGKPLRHALRNFRRIHVEGSFVLLYEIKEYAIVLIDFDHHDRIYKKYS